MTDRDAHANGTSPAQDPPPGAAGAPQVPDDVSSQPMQSLCPEGLVRLPLNVQARRTLDGAQACPKCSHAGPVARLPDADEISLRATGAPCAECGSPHDLKRLGPPEYCVPPAAIAHKWRTVTGAVAARANVIVPTGSVHSQQKRMKPREWLVEGLLSSGLLVLLVGKPGSFKSWLASALAVALAAGRAFLGHLPVPRPCRVLLLDQDSPKEELLDRLHRLMLPLRDARFRAEWNLVVASHAGIFLESDEGKEKLDELVARHRPDVLIIDSLKTFVAAFDENSADDAGPVMVELRQIAEKHKCTVVVLHHLRKDAREGTNDEVRGSGAIVAACDMLLRVQKWDESGRFLVRPVEKRVKVRVPKFLAAVRDVEAVEGGQEVAYVGDTNAEDPETEDQVEFAVANIRECGPDGGHVSTVLNASKKGMTEKDARFVLALAVKRGLLVRSKEAHGKFHFWAPEFAPQTEPGGEGVP